MSTLSLLVYQLVALRSEARESYAIAIASLGYDIVDCYFGS